MKKFAEKYFDVLRGTLEGLNLTAFDTFDEFYQKLVIDSVLPLRNSQVFSELLASHCLLMDVGFGGGFPLLPLAYNLLDVNCIGIEARKKKVDAVKIIAQQLNLSNVKVYHQRLNNILFNKKTVITFKAVGTCWNLLKEIQHTEDVFVFFYKGPHFHKIEGEDLEKIEKNWEKIEEKELSLENTEGRLLVGFKNKKKSNVSDLKSGGSRTGKKSLVNITSLI